MLSLDVIETKAVDFVAKISPWCAPIPTAYLVGRATVSHLEWPIVVGVVAAVIVETMGLASTSTALELYQYNQSRRKTDPIAPFALAAALVALYFLVTTGLTVFLDISPVLARYAPVIFPALSLTGIMILALRSDHKRRLQVIADEKAERRAARLAAKRAGTSGEVSKIMSSNVKSNTLDRMQAARRARLEARLNQLCAALTSNPALPISEAARDLGISRQTVYSYLDTLEQTGRIRRNGNGIEVLQ